MSSISENQKNSMLQMIRMGCDRAEAAKTMYVGAARLHRELKRDSEFAQELLRAEGAAELHRMNTLHKAADDVKHWRAATWWLEQKAKKRFARKRTRHATTRDMQQYLAELVDVIFSGVKCEEDRERVLQRLAEMANALDAKVDEPDMDSE